MMEMHIQDRSGERGNVLFLILIAVALFAALSYAVTQSSRSGGGDTSGETTLINSAQLTQYPASVRTSIIRMLVNGTGVDELNFNTPPDFGNLFSNAVGVFHPSGGAAVYSPAPPDIMADGNQGDWVFNANLEVPDIGTTGAGGNELIAFLPGVKATVCRKVNEQLGIGDVAPQVSADLAGAGGYDEANLVDPDNTANGNDATANFPTGAVTKIIDDGANTFDGQPYGCFQNNGSGDEYVYYHVLVER